MTEPGGGAFAGRVFVCPVRVYYEDTDAFGVVYYANYLKFAERARSEMLRAFGTNNMHLRAECDRLFVVRRCSADYRKSARLDDLLSVETTVAHVLGGSFHVHQRVVRGGELLVAIDVLLACVNGRGVPARMPAGLRATLRQLVPDNERLDNER